MIAERWQSYYGTQTTTRKCQWEVKSDMTLSPSVSFSHTYFLTGPRGKLKMTFLHMMYHGEDQETQEKTFATLFHPWQHSIWFRPLLFEISEVKDNFSRNPSWVSVWSYSSWLILNSCHMQFHAIFTTQTDLYFVKWDKTTDHTLAFSSYTYCRPMTSSSQTVITLFKVWNLEFHHWPASI